MSYYQTLTESGSVLLATRGLFLADNYGEQFIICKCSSLELYSSRPGRQVLPLGTLPLARSAVAYAVLPGGTPPDGRVTPDTLLIVFSDCTFILVQLTNSDRLAAETVGSGTLLPPAAALPPRAPVVVAAAPMGRTAGANEARIAVCACLEADDRGYLDLCVIHYTPSTSTLDTTHTSYTSDGIKGLQTIRTLSFYPLSSLAPTDPPTLLALLSTATDNTAVTLEVVNRAVRPRPGSCQVTGLPKSGLLAVPGLPRRCGLSTAFLSGRSVLLVDPAGAPRVVTVPPTMARPGAGARPLSACFIPQAHKSYLISYSDGTILAIGDGTSVAKVSVAGGARLPPSSAMTYLARSNLLLLASTHADAALVALARGECGVVASVVDLHLSDCLGPISDAVVTDPANLGRDVVIVAAKDSIAVGYPGYRLDALISDGPELRGRPRVHFLPPRSAAAETEAHYLEDAGSGDYYTEEYKAAVEGLAAGTQSTDHSETGQPPPEPVTVAAAAAVAAALSAADIPELVTADWPLSSTCSTACASIPPTLSDLPATPATNTPAPAAPAPLPCAPTPTGNTDGALLLVAHHPDVDGSLGSTSAFAVTAGASITFSPATPAGLDLSAQTLLCAWNRPAAGDAGVVHVVPNGIRRAGLEVPATMLPTLLVDAPVVSVSSSTTYHDLAQHPPPPPLSPPPSPATPIRIRRAAMACDCLVVTTGHSAYILHAATLAPVGAYIFRPAVTAVALSHDGAVLYVGLASGAVAALSTSPGSPQRHFRVATPERSLPHALALARLDTARPHLLVGLADGHLLALPTTAGGAQVAGVAVETKVGDTPVDLTDLGPLETRVRGTVEAPAAASATSVRGGSYFLAVSSRACLLYYESSLHVVPLTTTGSRRIACTCAFRVPAIVETICNPPRIEYLRQQTLRESDLLLGDPGRPHLPPFFALMETSSDIHFGPSDHHRLQLLAPTRHYTVTWRRSPRLCAQPVRLVYSRTMHTIFSLLISPAEHIIAATSYATLQTRRLLTFPSTSGDKVTALACLSASGRIILLVCLSSPPRAMVYVAEAPAADVDPASVRAAGVLALPAPVYDVAADSDGVVCCGERHVMQFAVEVAGEREHEVDDAALATALPPRADPDAASEGESDPAVVSDGDAGDHVAGAGEVGSDMARGFSLHPRGLLAGLRSPVPSSSEGEGSSDDYYDSDSYELSDDYILDTTDDASLNEDDNDADEDDVFATLEVGHPLRAGEVTLTLTTTLTVTGTCTRLYVERPELLPQPRPALPTRMVLQQLLGPGMLLTSSAGQLSVDASDTTGAARGAVASVLSGDTLVVSTRLGALRVLTTSGSGFSVTASLLLDTPAAALIAAHTNLRLRHLQLETNGQAVRFVQGAPAQLPQPVLVVERGGAVGVLTEPQDRHVQLLQHVEREIARHLSYQLSRRVILARPGVAGRAIVDGDAVGRFAALNIMDRESVARACNCTQAAILAAVEAVTSKFI